MTDPTQQLREALRRKIKELRDLSESQFERSGRGYLTDEHLRGQADANEMVADELEALLSPEEGQDDDTKQVSKDHSGQGRCSCDRSWSPEGTRILNPSCPVHQGRSEAEALDQDPRAVSGEDEG